jgi:hypothetical protein
MHQRFRSKQSNLQLAPNDTKRAQKRYFRRVVDVKKMFAQSSFGRS